MILLPRADELARIGADAPGSIDACDAPDGADPGSRTVRRGETVVVDGWCADPGTLLPASAVAVTCGDRVVAAAGGVPRHDVVAALGVPPERADYGFVGLVDTTGMPLGTHLLRIALRTADGSWRVVRHAATIEIVPSGAGGSIAGIPASPSVVIDPVTRALDGTPIGGTVSENEVVVVAGWALDARQRPGRSVAIAVDGTIVGEAAYGVPRPDVRAHFGLEPRDELCGFRFRLQARRLGRGKRSVQPVFRDGGGTEWTAEHPQILDVAPTDAVADSLFATAAPAARFDEARAVRRDGTIAAAADPLQVRPGEIIVVRGWAVDAERRADPSRVFVVLDGSVPVEAPAGLPRPDVYEQLGYGSRSGFEVAVPLDGIAPGSHTLEAFVGTADGSALVPAGVRVDFVVIAS